MGEGYGDDIGIPSYLGAKPSLDKIRAEFTGIVFIRDIKLAVAEIYVVNLESEQLLYFISYTVGGTEAELSPF
jgi:hypothetical protein